MPKDKTPAAADTTAAPLPPVEDPVTPATDFAEIPGVINELDPGEPHPSTPIAVPTTPPVAAADAAPSRAFVGFTPGV